MDRIFGILNLLIQNNDYVSIKKLSGIFNVSTRTIREDINKIEEYLSAYNVSLIKDKHLGIKIEEGVKKETIEMILKNINSNGYYTNEDRCRIIIQAFLLEKEEITIKTLIYLTKSSRTTVLKDLIKCESWLNERNISVFKKPYYGMYLIYEERDYRKTVIDQIMSYTKAFDYYSLYDSILKSEFFFSDFPVDNLINYYTDGINLLAVKNFIKKYEEKEKVKFTDESFINIFLYLCISIKRVKENHLIMDYDIGFSDIVNDASLSENMKIFEKEISTVHNVSFGEKEIMHLLCYILAQNKTYFAPKAENINEKDIVRKFVLLVQNSLGINLLNDEKLFDGLLLHIIPTIHRLLYNIKAVNPLKKEIMEQFGEIFMACKVAGRVFEEELGKNVKLDDDELSFLTLHIAASIEKIRHKAKAKNIKKAIVICSSGIGTSNMLSARLNTEFPSLLINNIYSIDELSEINIDDVDFVLSTIPLAVRLKKTIINVTPLLNAEDIRKIKNYIYISAVDEKMKREDADVVSQIIDIVKEECDVKDYEKLKNKVDKYFRERLIGDVEEKNRLINYLKTQYVKVNVKKMSWEDAVRFAGGILYDAGFVSGEYVDDMVLAVKEFGPYIIIEEGIALAHGKSGKGVFKTGMSFVTFKDGIDFGHGSSPVRLIIALASTGDASHLDAVSDLFDFIRVRENLDEWFDSASADEFISFVMK